MLTCEKSNSPQVGFPSGPTSAQRGITASEAGVTETPYQETEHHTVARDFLTRTNSVLSTLLAE